MGELRYNNKSFRFDHGISITTCTAYLEASVEPNTPVFMALHARTFHGFRCPAKYNRYQLVYDFDNDKFFMRFWKKGKRNHDEKDVKVNNHEEIKKALLAALASHR